jgi:general secretion pathway protein B
VQAAPPQPVQTASPVPEPATAGVAQQPVQTETSSYDKGQREMPPPVAARIPAREAARTVVDNAASGARTQPREAQSASKQALLREYELPPAIQQEIPKITISAHFYDADPSASIVSIRGNVMHEGQEVAAGLKLERITPEGVILNYKYYRFYRPVF